MWAVGQKAVDALESTHGVAFTLKIPSGRYGGFSMDWAKGVRNIKYPVLIELRDTGSYGFLLPTSQIIPSGEETLAAIAVYLREIIADFNKSRD
jgi:carboxypeptidase A5